MDIGAAVISKNIFKEGEFFIRNSPEIRLFLKVALFTGLIVGGFAVLYFPGIQMIIKDICEGRSLPILLQLFPCSEETGEPLGLLRIDHLIWRHYIPKSTATFLFFFAVYRLLKYLFGRLRRLDEDRDGKPQPEIHGGINPGQFRFDWLAALGIYTAITVVYYLHYLPNLGTYLIGPAEDNMLSIHNLWWGYRTLVEGKVSLTFSNMLCFPEGVSLYYHAQTFYNQFLSLPLQALFGLTTTYNLLLLHTFPVAGLGAFLLVRYLTGNSWAAIIGGFIFAFNPAHAERIYHHLNISSIQFVPFFVLYYIKAAREKSLGNVVLGALFFLLNTLCDWTFMIFCLYFIFFAYLYLAIRRRKVFLRDIFGKSLVIVGVTFLLLGPWLYQMIVIGLTHASSSGGGHDGFIADLAALIAPPEHHLLGGSAPIQWLNGQFHGNPWESTVYLGVVAVVIVAVNFKKIFAVSIKYLIAVLPFLILAMGVRMTILGNRQAIMLPYYFLSQVPFLSNMRAPSRHIIYLYLFFAVMVALAMSTTYNHLHLKKYGKLLFAGVALLLLLDYYSFNQAAASPETPVCYEVIKKESPKAAVLDLPSGYANVARYMMYQTSHRLPLVQGYVSRKVDSTLIDCLEMTNLATQKAQLIENGVGYIVIHKVSLTPDSVDAEAYRQVYKTIYEDGGNLVLRVE